MTNNAVQNSKRDLEEELRYLVECDTPPLVRKSGVSTYSMLNNGRTRKAVGVADPHRFEALVRNFRQQFEIAHRHHDYSELIGVAYQMLDYLDGQPTNVRYHLLKDNPGCAPQVRRLTSMTEVESIWSRRQKNTWMLRIDEGQKVSKIGLTSFTNVKPQAAHILMTAAVKAMTPDPTFLRYGAPFITAGGPQAFYEAMRRIPEQVGDGVLHVPAKGLVQFLPQSHYVILVSKAGLEPCRLWSDFDAMWAQVVPM